MLQIDSSEMSDSITAGESSRQNPTDRRWVDRHVKTTTNQGVLEFMPVCGMVMRRLFLSLAFETLINYCLRKPNRYQATEDNRQHQMKAMEVTGNTREAMVKETKQNPNSL